MNTADNADDTLYWPNGTCKKCASCGEDTVHSRMEETAFQYGVDEAAVEISVKLPVHRCDVCDIEFTDGYGEELRHAAVCRHLGVMTPEEIVALRERYGSQSEFAELTRIDEATISRWEVGNVIQNAAYDRYLYLLSFPENIARLKSRSQHQ